MSFRELRSFTEIMRSLGYPRLISMENFRAPNFELVADCLYWLVQRYYPGCDVSDDISTESERVKFLQSVAQIMLTKARMKLNIKKLYSADGFAVKEMLKLASLLYKATEKAANDDDDNGEVVDMAQQLKGFNPKEVKTIASEIVKSGAALHDAIGAEQELKEHRARAIAGHVDTEFVERSINEAVAQVEDNVKTLEGQLDELERNEKTLDSKIEKKKQELERNEKRLSTLQSVRPAYMDEYERLQGELNVLYASYLDKFRNLEFMENELEAYYQAEQEKLEAQERRLKKMQKKMAADEMRVLRGEAEVDEGWVPKDLADGSDDDLEDDSELLGGGDDDDVGGSGGGGGDQGAGGGAGGLGSTMRRGGGGGGSFGGGGGQRVVGSLGANFNDEASIDEDDNSDGGEVSRAGSPDGGGYANGGYDDRPGGADIIDDDDDDDDDDF